MLDTAAQGHPALLQFARQVCVIHLAPENRALPCHILLPAPRSYNLQPDSLSWHLLWRDFIFKMPEQAAYLILASVGNTEVHPPKELRFNTGQTATLGVMLTSYHSNSPMDVSSLFVYELDNATRKTCNITCVISKTFSKQALWHSNTEWNTHRLKGSQYSKCADDPFSFH